MKLSMALASRGSSPRTWGNEVESEFNFGFNRFIPTHVGKCYLVVGKVDGMPVHPHARGEM